MKDRLRNLLDREKGAGPSGAGATPTPAGDPDARSSQGSAAGPPAKQVAARIADGFKKALGAGAGGRRAAEAERAAAAAVEAYGGEVAGDTLAALGLAAFAIAAFLKTVLYPELAGFTPGSSFSPLWVCPPSLLLVGNFSRFSHKKIFKNAYGFPEKDSMLRRGTSWAPFGELYDDVLLTFLMYGLTFQFITFSSSAKCSDSKFSISLSPYPLSLCL